MNFSISAIEWKNWESLWRYKYTAATSYYTNFSFCRFVITKITKPVVENLSESSQLNDFTNRFGAT